MSDPSRFTDNDNGTIYDSKTRLTWLKEDSWQSEAKWLTWDEAKEYAQNFSDNKFCGHMDWRLPTEGEALSLYDPESINQDKYGKEIHLHPIFPSGPLATIWLKDDQGGGDGVILDFTNGEIRPLYRSKSGRMATRPVRKD